MNEDLTLTYLWYGGIYDPRLGCFDMKFLGKQEIEMREDKKSLAESLLEQPAKSLYSTKFVGLKPCPGCNQAPDKLIDFGGLTHISCQNYSACRSNHFVVKSLEAEAIEIWNTRPRESALLDWVLERAKEKAVSYSTKESPNMRIPNVIVWEDLETIINEAKREV